MAVNNARPVMQIRIEMGPAQQLTGANSEIRLIYHISSGRFEGERLSGIVQPVAGDWVSVKGAQMKIDVRVTLETDDGAEITMSYENISALDPATMAIHSRTGKIERNGHFFRIDPILETKAEKYLWVNDLKVFGIGTRYEDRIDYDVYEADQDGQA